MVTSYIIILAISAWICSFGLLKVGQRLTRLLNLSVHASEGMMALLVALALLMVIGAPSWLLLAALALIAVPFTRVTSRLAPTLQWGLIIASLLPLIAAPLMGSPSWIALDAALITSSMFGALSVKGPATSLAAAFLPLTILLGWLAVQAALHGAWPVAVAAFVIYGGSLIYGLLFSNRELHHAL